MEFLRHPPQEFVHPEWINKYGDRIREGKRFLYELSTYKIYPNRAELLFQKFVESNEERESKCIVEYYPNKKKKEYIIEKSIIMLEAPKSYLQYLLKYEPIKKIKKNEKSSKLQSRRIR